MSLDDARGLLYLPVSTPSNDFYGGDRPGANLFGESLVCLDAATGRCAWHFQIVHHGLWDYDPASAPTLVTMTVDGRRVDAVVQLTKQGFAFVFDRVTGRPIWPIEERPVPASDVAGEQAWPTQPFPTKPAPFSPQGVVARRRVRPTRRSCKAQAQAEMKKYRIGPLYTPPSMDGTLMRPGIIGGANWGGAAFDAASGGAVHQDEQPAGARAHRRRRIDRRRTRARRRSTRSLVGAVGGAPTFTPPPPAGAAPGATVPALPIVKPPYGELVAIDLESRRDRAGACRSATRRRCAITRCSRTSTLPERLGVAGAPGVIVTAGGLVLGRRRRHRL